MIKDVFNVFNSNSFDFSTLGIFLLSLGCFVSIKQVQAGDEEEAQELKPTTASMSSQFKNFKAEYCINGKDDGAEGGKEPDMCHTMNGKKSDPYPWLAIDYGKDVKVSIGKVVIANRIKLGGPRTMKVEVRLTDELPSDGKSMLTSGQLVGKFDGPGKNGGQKIEIESEEGWEGMVGRYLIVQMDHSDKSDDNAVHGINLMEVTGFGQTWRKNCEKK